MDRFQPGTLAVVKDKDAGSFLVSGDLVVIDRRHANTNHVLIVRLVGWPHVKWTINEDYLDIDTVTEIEKELYLHK